MSLTGSGPDDPQRVGVPIADLLAGMYGAYGVLAALHERDRTGRGQVVRTSLLAAVVGVHAFQGTRWTVAGEVGRAQGNHHPSIAPYGLFHCRDGAVQIAVGSEGLWRRFCAGFGLDPDADGLATNADRVAAPRPADRGRRGGLRRLGRRAAARPARRARRPGGQGPHPRRGLRVGPDREPGAAARRRAPARSGTLTLPGPPLRFFDADGGEITRARPRARRRCSTSTATTVRAWLEARSESAGDPSLDRPTSCSTWCSTRAPSSPGTRRSTSPRHVRRGYRAELGAAGREGGHRRVGAHRPRPGPRSAGARWSPTSSASSPAPSGGPRPTGSPPPYAGRPPSGCRSSRRTASGGTRMQEGTPGVRRDGRDLAGARWPTAPPACPTSCTCGTPPPAACTPRGARSATSPSPSPARWSASSARRSTRRSTGGRSRPGCRPPRTSPPRASSTRVVAAEDLPGARRPGAGVLRRSAGAAGAAAASVEPGRRHRRRPGTRSSSPAPPVGPACATCCGTARAAPCGCAAPTRASATRP